MTPNQTVARNLLTRVGARAPWRGFSLLALGAGMVACGGGGDTDATGGEDGVDDYQPEVACTVYFSGSGTDDVLIRQTYDAQGRIMRQGDGFGPTTEGAVVYDRTYNGTTPESLTVTTYGATGSGSVRETEYDADGYLIYSSVDQGGNGQVDTSERRAITVSGDTITAEIDWMDDGTVDQTVVYTSSGNSLSVDRQNASGAVLTSLTATMSSGRITEATVRNGSKTTISEQEWSWNDDDLVTIDNLQPGGPSGNGEPVRRLLSVEYLTPGEDQPSSVKRFVDRGDDGTDDRSFDDDFVYEGDCSALGDHRVYGTDFNEELLSIQPLLHPISL